MTRRVRTRRIVPLAFDELDDDPITYVDPVDHSKCKRYCVDCVGLNPPVNTFGPVHIVEPKNCEWSWQHGH
jgi:hypothetical protein